MVKTLRQANHDVVTVTEANLTGQPDNMEETILLPVALFIESINHECQS
ncbi:MAG: hypothetical protein F6K41_14225 [Symploca sp. SIO3E6]|nr:hypothetical protein [Caldora sp. SIO3E6]